MIINHLRSKYKKEIEKIREKVRSENTIISLSGIDEIIILLEKLSLKERSEIQDLYLEKLLDYAIRLCETVNGSLINESHIKKAYQEIYRIEGDMMRKIQSIERIGVIDTEKQPADVEVFKEEVELSTPEVQPEEFKVIQGEEIIIASEEKLIQKEVSIEEIVVSKPEEQPKEILPPEPQIIKCPFCGLIIDEKPTFCPQCGMIFKKK